MSLVFEGQSAIAHLSIERVNCNFARTLALKCRAKFLIFEFSRLVINFQLTVKIMGKKRLRKNIGNLARYFRAMGLAKAQSKTAIHYSNEYKKCNNQFHANRNCCLIIHFSCKLAFAKFIFSALDPWPPIKFGPAVYNNPKRIMSCFICVRLHDLSSPFDLQFHLMFVVRVAQ